MCLLGAVLYFSHLFTFLVYLFFIAAHELTLWSGHKNTWLFLRRSTALLLAPLPWLLLSAWYFKHNPSGAGEDTRPASKTIGFYMAADYLKVYSLDTSLARTVLVYLVLAASIACGLGIQWYNFRGQKAIDAEYKDFIKAEKYIDHNSIVAPFFFNRCGFAEHFSNYLSNSKDLIILENYEAATQYFPVVWRKDNMQQAYFTDSLSVISQGLFTTGQKHGTLTPDYVVINGRDPGNAVYRSLIRHISRPFSLIYSNNTVSLYKKHGP